MAVLTDGKMAALRRKKISVARDLEVEEARELPASGVRRAARAVPVDEETPAVHVSQRPTVPAPKAQVIEEDSPAADVYAKVMTGTLAQVTATQAEPLTPAVTRNLFIALGSLDRIPARSCSTDQLRSAAIEPRHAFILDLLDGKTSIESVIDASPMPMHKVLLTLAELLTARLIVLLA